MTQLPPGCEEGRGVLGCSSALAPLATIEEGTVPLWDIMTAAALLILIKPLKTKIKIVKSCIFYMKNKFGFFFFTRENYLLINISLDF